MSNVLDQRWFVTAVRRRVLATSAFIALLLGIGAYLAASPDAAQAGTPNCPYYNFCLWHDTGFNGGRYNWSGSDSNLCNDYYVGTNTTVCDSESSAQNNGSPATYDDVRAYYYLNYGGASLCVPRGAAYSDLGVFLTPYGNTWNNNIESYRWVTSC
jgi:hypothetical protein